MRGEIRPGTHLVEGALAEQYGVSRGPVRDALRQLEIEGLVESRKRGAFVRGLTETDLVELYACARPWRRWRSGRPSPGSPTPTGRPVDDAVAAMREAAAARSGSVRRRRPGLPLRLLRDRRQPQARRHLGLHRPIFAAMLEVTNTDRDLGPVAQDHADLSSTIRSGEIEAALAALAAHLDGSCARMRAVLAERLRAA